jgi:hypothetical protein
MRLLLSGLDAGRLPNNSRKKPGDRQYCTYERTRVLPDTVLSLGASRAGLSNDDYDLPAVFFAAVGRYLRRIASRS